ncbi:DUF7700 domain-containing protein [Rhodococcus sp. YH1]|uniref:DUF7700 domain-containing protein n=1 Tax=Rhodococcus sp. YH1 TaxID=89066 RepID=UPI00192E38DA|nr:hypothetical protein [Rhodococcus sp. YH1]
MVVAATTYYQAGAVTFGVEGRAVYGDDNDASCAEGPTLHVFDTETGLEHLRFDALPGEEHYHYLTPGEQNYWIGFDTVANGEFTAWILDRVRTRLPDLLREAGAADHATRVDPEAVDTILPRVETHLRIRDLRLPANRPAAAPRVE